MSKDTAENRLIGYPDVAADIIDGVIYGGQPVVKAEDLKLVSGEGYILDEIGKLRGRYRDRLFEDWTHGCRYLFWGVENQTNVDNTLPLSLVGFDYTTYKRQVDEFMDENKRTKNPAYTKRIHDTQKLIPTVTIVLYYGEEWTGPRSLLDMVDLEDREALAPYMMDYRVNLVELGKDKEYYKRFHSDFRLLAQYIASKNDREALTRFWKESRPVRHVEAFLDVMSEVGTNRNYKVMKEKILKKEEQEVVTMTDVEKEYWAEVTRSGMEQGMKQGMKQGMTKGAEMKLISQVCRKLQKGKEPEEIAEDLEEDFEVVERICKVAGKDSAGYDADAIYQALQLEVG